MHTLTHAQEIQGEGGWESRAESARRHRRRRRRRVSRPQHFVSSQAALSRGRGEEGGGAVWLRAAGGGGGAGRGAALPKMAGALRRIPVTVSGQWGAGNSGAGPVNSKSGPQATVGSARPAGRGWGRKD